MIVTRTYHPHTLDSAETASSTPVGGDPAKPGAWAPDQIAEWNRAKACAAEGHAPFWLMNPRATDDTCPGCDTIVRSITTADGWADHAAEQRADDQAYRDSLLEDREQAR